MHFLCVTGGIYVSLILMKKQNKIKFGEQATCTKQKNTPSGAISDSFLLQYGKKKESKLYQALADTIMRANWKELKEERRMCQALRELFADDLRESELKGRNAGKREGKIEGKMEAKIELIIKKYKKGCSAEETADMLEEPINLMRQIYEMLDQYTPDYDVEKIYKGLLEKAILPV